MICIDGPRVVNAALAAAVSAREEPWMTFDPALLYLILALIAAGAIAGVAAGLFGIGGGIVIVPALYHAFGALGVSDETRMHAAIATSLATIVATSVRSTLAHHKRGAVDLAILKSWTPWIVVGAFAGALVARAIPPLGLTIAFAVGGLLMAARMAFGGGGKPLFAAMPTGAARAGAAGLVGLLSAWMGIGGGMFGVMIMTLAGRPIHQAVGTAAGFGAAIGLPGALGFMLAGQGVEGLPPWSIGYVNLPGLVLVGTLTVLFAPLGARLAHSLSQTVLKRVFAAGVTVIALQMLAEAAGLWG